MKSNYSNKKRPSWFGQKVFLSKLSGVQAGCRYVNDDGILEKTWMRGSRYVAREFAHEKRLDTFSPATGAHTSNLLPVKYLGMKAAIKELPQSARYDVVLGCLDVKDAFLQVEQEKPILVHIQGCPYVIKRNLPGQRLGAKQWYQHLRSYLTTMFNYEWCSEQPCMARNGNSVILIHVDDILYVGRKTYWQDFLKGMKEKFSVRAMGPTFVFQKEDHWSGRRIDHDTWY